MMADSTFQRQFEIKTDIVALPILLGLHDREAKKQSHSKLEHRVSQRSITYL